MVLRCNENACVFAADGCPLWFLAGRCSISACVCVSTQAAEPPLPPPRTRRLCPSAHPTKPCHFLELCAFDQDSLVTLLPVMVLQTCCGGALGVCKRKHVSLPALPCPAPAGPPLPSEGPLLCNTSPLPVLLLLLAAAVDRSFLFVLFF